MSDLLDRSEYDSGEFQLDEKVSFLYRGERLHGVVARVYSTREIYHVEVDGQRYSVHSSEDDMRRD